METKAKQDSTGKRWAPGPLDLRLVALLAGVKLAVHLATAGRYGYFRDELYFLDCARHLDWGYVDCAPAIALYAKIALLLGGSLPVLRTIAALAGAARVALTMALAREMEEGASRRRSPASACSRRRYTSAPTASSR